MSEKKQNILDFIQDYYSEYNGLIGNYIQSISGEEKEDNELKENLFDALIELKKSIPSKLNDYGIDNTHITSKLKNEDDVISLIKNIYDQYGNNLTLIEIEDIIETTLLSEQQLNKEEIENYINKINNYINDHIINNLYELTFLNKVNNNVSNIDDDFNSIFNDFFKESLVKLKLSQKAELYSQLNVFVEEYAKTPLGEKHMQIMYNQYLDDKNKNTGQDKNYAVRNYLLNILSAYNACTPTENNILVDSDKIKINTAKGGTFDALLFINTTLISDDRKKEFDSITTIDELNNFKSSISNISQYQISATADRGFDIESGSVIKHCLSSIVINKILNLYWVRNADDNFIDLFSTTNIGSATFNQNMKGAITHAIKTICPELIDHLFKNKKNIIDENFFSEIQKKMNKNPILFIDYLNNKYGSIIVKKENLIRNNINLTQDDMTLFENLEKKYQHLKYRHCIFKNKSLLCLFRKEEAYKNVNIDIDTKTRLSPKLRSELKKQNLSTNEVILLIQFNSIVKSSYLGSETAHNQSIINLVDNFFDIRGIGLINKYNNQLLQQFQIKDIDQLIVQNFLYGNNSLSNLKKLNKQDMENTVQCIVLYFDSVDKDDKLKIFEHLKSHSEEVKYLREALNKVKMINKISDITEKDIIIEEKDIIIENERKKNEEAYKIIEKERKAKEEDRKKNIMSTINQLISCDQEIPENLSLGLLNNHKESFGLFSSEEIENIKKDLSVKPELLKLFNEFLKENDLFQVNSKDLLNESFNNNTKANEVIEEINNFINNSQNKKYKKEHDIDSTTRLENLFLSIESKIENKEILEMVKNSIEENKNHYPKIWKKLSSIEFEEFINKKILKNN